MAKLEDEGIRRSRRSPAARRGRKFLELVEILGSRPIRYSNEGLKPGLEAADFKT